MLQSFAHIELAEDVCPQEAKPPAQWATDVDGSPRKKTERIYPKSHLTLYANVCLFLLVGFFARLMRHRIGRSLGSDGCGKWQCELRSCR